MMPETSPQTAAACPPWCTQHDPVFGQHRGETVTVPNTLEADASNVAVATILGDPSERPAVILWQQNGTGTTLTPNEAARLAVELWAAAAVAVKR